MNPVGMTVGTCATLLWAGTVLAKGPTCTEREANEVAKVEHAQQMCIGKLTKYGCDAGGCSLAQCQTFPATGQTTTYVAGDDGDIKAGAALAYTDHGDGTITDNNTKLVWEKKADDGSLHDQDNCYPWAGVCSGDGTTYCGTDADCTGAGGTCDATDCQTAAPNGLTIFKWVAQLNAGAGFAGHTDWRVPNIKELQSIVNYGISYPGPTVDAAFNTSCATGCTVDGAEGTQACSCTSSGYYWSATTIAGYQSWVAWYVHFFNGTVDGDATTSFYDMHVRAVRGAL